MSRPIQFRAWDEDMKLMYDGDEIESREDIEAFLSYGELQIYHVVDGDWRQLLPLQYTGDENRGYEGDILEWVEPIRGEHGDIYDFEHCRGVVEWDNERSGFIVRCANGIEWLDDLMNITIIGNIYDHPHLLKGDDTDATS